MKDTTLESFVIVWEGTTDRHSITIEALDAEDAVRRFVRGGYGVDASDVDVYRAGEVADVGEEPTAAEQPAAEEPQVSPVRIPPGWPRTRADG